MPFQGTPLLLETSEFIADEGDDMFWNFMEAWEEPKKGKNVAANCPESILDFSRNFLPERMIKVGSSSGEGKFEPQGRCAMSRRFP